MEVKVKNVVCTECGGDRLWHGKEGHLVNPQPVRGDMRCAACRGMGFITEVRRNELIGTDWPRLVEQGRLAPEDAQDKVQRLEDAWAEKYPQLPLRIQDPGLQDARLALRELMAFYSEPKRNHAELTLGWARRIGAYLERAA